jgi:hypothetical protein
MATIEIPDEVYERLAKRARVLGRTVAEDVAQILRQVHIPLDRAERSKLLAELRARPKIESDLDPVALIREDRDSR